MRGQFEYQFASQISINLILRSQVRSNTGLLVTMQLSLQLPRVRNYLLQAPINLQLDVANHWNLNGKPSLPRESLQNHWKNNLNNLNHQFPNYCELI